MRLKLFCNMALLALACSGADRIELRLERVANRGNLHGYGVDVRLNDSRPIRVLLDTGATGLLLARDLLPTTGIRPQGTNLIGGVGDEREGRRVNVWQVDRLEIGELTFPNMPVRTADREFLMGLDGILGADVFAAFLLTLDFPNRRLALERRVAGPEEGFLPMHRDGHALLVSARVNRQDGVLLQIDSGANQSLLDHSVARRVARVEEDLFQQVRGVSGEVARVWRVERAVFEVGQWRLVPGKVAAISLARQNQQRPFEVQGILGLPELSRGQLLIDYRQGLIKLTASR